MLEDFLHHVGLLDGGDGLFLTDLKSGEGGKVELFVAALGASSYVCAKATLSQSSPVWIASHVWMAEYFGGVSQI